jgi:phosphoribosylamine--glycine ligase
MRDKTVLVIGGGGREHALAWKLAQSPQVAGVIVGPGNAGTEWPAREGLAPCERAAVQPTHFADVLALAREHSADLVVVGPEGPLAAGLTDRLNEAGIPAFGPGAAAARIEASKAYAKAFMQRNGIPTAAYATFTDKAEALAYVHEVAHPVVVKASGLAAGKGVIICENTAQAAAAVESIMEEGRFGEAGERVVIEERLEGREASLLAFTDGETVIAMPPTRDHKQVYDGDKGPNTGGMGAYAPVPDLPPGQVARLIDTVLLPTVRGMAEEGARFRGVLYAGLMLNGDDVRVLEFNCRFGDPETQVILPLLEGDLYEICEACAVGNLHPTMVSWADKAAAVVVLASPGYPGKYPKGLPITGLGDLPAGVMAFHAGTARDGHGKLATMGGRVLGIAATGVELTDALRSAYAGVEAVSFEGMHYRTDIGVNYV